MKEMKKILILALIISSLANLYLWGNDYFKEINFKKKEFSALVVKIVDGDTFDIQGGKRVRLGGIDAPEYPQGCLSEEAKRRLEELILGKMVKIRDLGEDNFKRKIGWVEKEGIAVNLVLVEEGWARVEKAGEEYESLLFEKQEEAKKLKRGIWSAKCLPQEGCLIKGNFRRDRGTKIYHLPECFNYEKIVVDEKTGDRWFCTEEEAIRAGFRKSEDCP